ncbi:MAG: toxin YoeB [Clostridiales bacterium]|nr:toxin YoeB [Clostridiales bacterium]
MYRIVYTKQAVKDIKKLKASGLSAKAKELIEVIREDPFKNPPPYEGLVGNLDGFYSRRINIKHRLVYQVYADNIEIDGMEYEGTVKIVRMWTHYEAMR